jgi:hypothetical protein
MQNRQVRQVRAAQLNSTHLSFNATVVQCYSYSTFAIQYIRNNKADRTFFFITNAASEFLLAFGEPTFLITLLQ